MLKLMVSIVIIAYRLGISSFEGNIVIMPDGDNLLTSPVFLSFFFFKFTFIFDSPLPVGQTFHHTDKRISLGPMYGRVVALLSDSV